MAKQRSETFDEVAQLYDAVRPSYPDALFEAIVELAQLPDDAHILEIGAGTGKATLPFARRGYAMHCLEPGANLVSVLTRNVCEYPKVTVEPVSFEGWSLRENSFDLVISAQAFHWVSKEIGYMKSAQALKETGSIALFWNVPPDSDSELDYKIDEAYRTYAPEVAKGGSLATSPHSSFEERIRDGEVSLMESGYFKEVVVKQFPWSQWYDTTQYLDLLNTYSDHRLLNEETRKVLFDQVAAILTENGGGIEKQHIATLFVAKRDL
ncbi:MAG: class I SAM-dependent methyltransferase [Chloroflexota bacterium]